MGDLLLAALAAGASGRGARTMGPLAVCEQSGLGVRVSKSLGLAVGIQLGRLAALASAFAFAFAPALPVRSGPHV